MWKLIKWENVMIKFLEFPAGKTSFSFIFNQTRELQGYLFCICREASIFEPLIQIYFPFCKFNGAK